MIEKLEGLYSKEFNEVKDSFDIPIKPFNPKEDWADVEFSDNINNPIIKILLKESLQLLYEYSENLHKDRCFELAQAYHTFF